MLQKINGININYEIYGKGTPVLILHGWGGCIESMSPITNDLKNNYQVIVVDFIGHGKSGFPDVPLRSSRVY